MRKIFIFLFVLTTMFLATSCKPIEDTNGVEDKSLVTITDAKFTNTISGYISEGSSKRSGTPSTQRFKNDGGISDDKYDYDNIEFDFKRLNGTQKAMLTYVKKGQSLTINISSFISKGNFAAVLISPSKEIVAKFETDSDDTVTITAKDTGDYALVIGGESAEGKVKISRIIK